MPNNKKLFIIKILLAIIAIIAVAIGCYYAYLAGFIKTSFSISEQGGETIVYKEMVGDYSKSGELRDKIYYELLNNEKIQTTKGIGIYYDDPKIVEKTIYDLI